MNDEINRKNDLAEEWEMSLSDALPNKNAPKSGSTVQNQSEDRTIPSAGSSQPNEERKGKTDEWSMTAPLKPPPTAPDASGWKLPEPVFRSSEGYTPKLSPASSAAPTTNAAPDFEDSNDFSAPSVTVTPAAAPEISFAQIETPVELKQEIAPAIPPAAASKVEPQPDVIEDLPEIPPAAPAPAVKPKSKAGRIAGITAGLLAMIAFIVGFLILIYYFFLQKPPAE